jgi:hypothetical protein
MSHTCGSFMIFFAFITFVRLNEGSAPLESLLCYVMWTKC